MGGGMGGGMPGAAGGSGRDRAELSTMFESAAPAPMAKGRMVMLKGAAPQQEQASGAIALD